MNSLVNVPRVNVPRVNVPRVNSLEPYILYVYVYVTGKVGNQVMLTLPRQCRQKFWLDCYFVQGKTTYKPDLTPKSKYDPKPDPKT